jgi:hypothetical protein
VTGEMLSGIQSQVLQARTLLDVDDALTGLRLLRQAEAAAGLLGSDIVPGPVFQALVDLRNELGCYLLAAEQMEAAGVERGAVVGVLRRGADTAAGILNRMAGAVGVGS